MTASGERRGLAEKSSMPCRPELHLCSTGPDKLNGGGEGTGKEVKFAEKNTHPAIAFLLAVGGKSTFCMRVFHICGLNQPHKLKILRGWGVEYKCTELRLFFLFCFTKQHSLAIYKVCMLP